ncbi:hypothetical protein [Endozoicomonas elysicola]|uniref:Uncharacterized protein n=1 Tax=Endozoicomonas elysicola TaxID=305900 RepID=A0A081KE70_9GAMM|nr:hypothetical protein [Endozoicomonas elysicola]KEI72446.1 hypothetical protein GV64_18465 [Endozoicomonas elysicola]
MEKGSFRKSVAFAFFTVASGLVIFSGFNAVGQLSRTSDNLQPVYITQEQVETSTEQPAIKLNTEQWKKLDIIKDMTE